MENQDNSGKQNAKFLGNIKEAERHNEPWFVGENGGIFSEKQDEAIGFLDFRDGAPRTNKHKNEKRIVACVNFCAGIKTSDLERESIQRLIAHRDDLCNEVELLRHRLGEILETSTRYFIGTENGIADIETPPSDN